MKKISLILMILIFASFAFALEAKQTSTDVSIIPEFSQPGRVHLSITGADAGEYNIYTLTAVRILPPSIMLGSGTNNVVVDIYPTNQLYSQGPIAYSFSYNLRKRDTNINHEASMVVRVVSIEDAFLLSSEPNSPDSENITFFIKNREAIDLKKITAKFSSIFFEIEETFDLKANEKKEFNIFVGKEKIKKIEAGSYLLTAEVETDKGIRTLEGRIFLGEKRGVEIQQKNSGIIIRRNDIAKVNYGNVVEDVAISINKNVITRLFTSFNIEPDTTTRRGLSVTYTWGRRLMPDDALRIRATTNFVLPLVIIIAIILIVIAFKRYTQAKVDIIKTAVPVKTSNGQFALKVKLHLKIKNSVRNVSVVDKIPAIVQIFEKFEGSNIKPSRIDIKNRRIQWDFGDMSAGEERVFSYMVYSKVGVVGKFSLLPALAVYEKENEIHETESNEVYFLAEQRAPDQ